MPDVFVSYSRRDIEFARALVDRLKATGRDVWVDIEGIPPSAEWLAEVHAAIDASATVIFVVSPDSLTSQVCGEELTYAGDGAKRIVPILRRESAGPLPAILVGRDAVRWREIDDPEAASRALSQALDANAEWAGAHARLLVRAREWERKGRNESLLLSGSALADAESRLAAGRDVDPKPTALQNEYVLEGRRNESTRQRRRLVAVSTVLAVALVLAVFAIGQRNRARTAAREAKSRALAASAEALFASNPQKGAIRAREAVLVAQTSEAQRAFQHSLFASRELLVLRGHTGAVTSVDFGKDGTVAVSGSEDGTARVWDLGSGKTLRTLQPKDGPVTRLDVSADGRYVVMNHRTAASVWEVGTGKLVRVLQAFGDNPPNTQDFFDVAFLRDPRYVMTAGTNDAVGVYDVQTGRRVARYVDTEEDRLTRVAVDFQERTVGATGSHGWWLWNGGDEFPLIRSEEGNTITAIASNPARYEFATSLDAGEVSFYEGKDLKIVAGLVGHVGGVGDLAYSSDGRRLVTAGSDGRVGVWDRVTHALLFDLRGHAGPVNDAIFSPDGRRIVSGGVDGTVRVWDAAPASAPKRFATAGNEVWRTRWARNGKTIVAGGAESVLRIYDAATAAERFVPLDGPARGIDVSRDGKFVAVATTGSSVYLVDVASARQQKVVDAGKRMFAVCFMPDGEHLYVSGEGAAGLVESRTGKPTWASPGDKDIAACDVSRDGRYIADATIGPGPIRIIEAASGKVVATLAEESTGTESVRFSPDGTRLLATGASNGDARVFDLRSKQTLFSLSEGQTSEAEFSPDGRLIVGCGFDNPGTIWDASGGLKVTTVAGSSGQYYSCSFSPDGRRFVVAGNTGSGAPGFAAVYDCAECGTTQDLLALFAKRIPAQVAKEEGAA